MTQIAGLDLLASLCGPTIGAKARARAQAEAGFDAALTPLKPGDLAVDLGANVGLLTARMAATGADVVAFAPAPYAFAVLTAPVHGMANGALISAAAGDAPGKLALFRHRDFAAGPDRRTTSSAILAGNRHMAETRSIAGKMVDFVASLASQNRPVALHKIDIEGAKGALLQRLLALPQADLVKQAFGATRERVIQHLRACTTAFKELAASRARPAINWDWH